MYTVCAYVTATNAFKMVLDHGLTIVQAKAIIHNFALHNPGLYAIIC